MTRRSSEVVGQKTRRRFLREATRVVAGAALFGSIGQAASLAAPSLVRGPLRKASKLRPDLLGPESPQGLEVFQLTTEPDVPSSHLYMEAQVFTMDSQRFVLHRSATAHGGSKSDPNHQYLLCDIGDGGTLHPLTEETGATAPSVSPDGKSLYYFVDQTTAGGGRLTLKRVHLDGTGRETILVLDTPLPDTAFRPSHIYPL